MKKLLVLLFSILISFNSYGDEIKSLFGITLNDNAENYFSSNYIDSNKYKNTETIKGYFNLIITEKIETKSPFASRYMIILDNNNRIHKIYGDREYSNLEICQAVRKELVNQIEEKYQIVTDYKEKSYPSFIRYSNYYWFISDNYLTIQCKKTYSTSLIRMQMSISSENVMDAVNEFYDAGI